MVLKSRKVTFATLDRYWAVFDKDSSLPQIESGYPNLNGRFGRVEIFITIIDHNPGCRAFRVMTTTWLHLFCGFTKEVYRNRGIYHAMIQYRLDRLKEPWE